MRSKNNSRSNNKLVYFLCFALIIITQSCDKEACGKTICLNNYSSNGNECQLVTFHREGRDYYRSGDSIFVDLDQDGQNDIYIFFRHWNSVSGSEKEDLRIDVINSQVQIAGSFRTDSILTYHRGENGIGPCEFNILSSDYLPRPMDSVIMKEPIEFLAADKIAPSSSACVDGLAFHSTNTAILWKNNSRYSDSYFCGMRSIRYGEWRPGLSEAGFLAFKVVNEAEYGGFIEIIYDRSSIEIVKSFFARLKI